MADYIQIQNIPPDIDPEAEDALYRVIDLAKQTIRKTIELEERIERNIGAVDSVYFRLYWDGMPIWGRLRAHSELFYTQKACVVASTYCNSWIFSSFDESNPFKSMAKAYTESMNGIITVNSTVNKGSTFSLDFSNNPV